jgi:hypothetical protein
MDSYDNFEGTLVTIKAKGAARFFGAGFLGIWLCGWLVGEVVALSFLFVIGWYLGTGELLIHRVTLPNGPALYVIGAFLLVWGTFWSIGGYGAMREFARLLWGCETLLLRPDGLRIRFSAFPFAKTREVTTQEMRGLSRAPRKKALMLDLAKGRTELSVLGSEEEKEELSKLLRRRYPSVFGPSNPADKEGPTVHVEAHLPADWVQESFPEGTRGVMRNQVNRRKQMLALWAVALAFDLLCAFLVYKAVSRISYAPVALIVATIGMACTYGAIRMGMGRPEWVLDRGVLRLQRRSGGSLKIQFEGARIELDSRESDENTWFNLYALSGDATGFPPYRTAQRKDIASKVNDPTELRRFGAFLAQQTGLPFIDRVSPERKGAELAALKERLEAGGAFSRWVAGKIKPPKA